MIEALENEESPGVELPGNFKEPGVRIQKSEWKKREQEIFEV
jgi:hypothetical protein